MDNPKVVGLNTEIQINIYKYQYLAYFMLLFQWLQF